MGAKEILLLLSLLFVAVHGKKDCCKLSGNGNYHQFDKGRMVHFRSNCTYNFASATNGSFQVWVDTEFHHDNPAVSFAYSTIIHYAGQTYVLTVDYVIMPGAAPIPISNFPTHDDGTIRIEHIGENIVFTIYPEDLELFWHGAHNLEVCLEPRWKQTNPSMLTGLCGNYNGNKHDDLVKPDGTPLSYDFDGYDLFGESWAVDWQDETGADCTEPPESWDVCTVELDPHGGSIDGFNFLVTEVCTYDLALNFYLNVSMETYRRNVIDIRRRVSFVRRLIIEYNGLEYSMYATKLTVGDVTVTNDANFDCHTGLYKFCCEAKVGTFKFCSNRKFSFSLYFEYYFYKALSGLCGNFNGIAADDYVLRGGGTPISMADFVGSWERPNCQ